MALEGVRVVELAHDRTAAAGRLLAELGADVIVVEPRGGSPTRRRPPFVDDRPGPDRSLRWWSGAAGKRSVALDLDEALDREQVARLVSTADIVLEGLGTGLDAPGISWAELDGGRGLIWASITSHGRGSPRSQQPSTDLTLLAGGGPLWNCGYDDHTIPPIRGAGEQSSNIGGLYAAMSCLVALAHRDVTGSGQVIDVNIDAACNVTSEHATYNWLLIERECARQTGRHASDQPTAPVQVRCADGRYATTGVLPRLPGEFGRLVEWLGDLDLREALPESVFLEMASSRTDPVDLSALGVDEETTAILGAARDAVTLIASRLSADEFYVQSQTRGFPAGAVRSPDEGFADPHFVARGFHAEVAHDDLGSSYVHPGRPYVSTEAPTTPLRRPPRVGEHTDEILGPRPHDQEPPTP